MYIRLPIHNTDWAVRAVHSGRLEFWTADRKLPGKTPTGEYRPFLAHPIKLRKPRSNILDFGFWFLDFGFYVLDFGFQMSLLAFRTKRPGGQL